MEAVVTQNEIVDDVTLLAQMEAEWHRQRLIRHPSGISTRIRDPLIGASKSIPGVWTEGVNSPVGVISSRYVDKILPNGKASFARKWKLDGKIINDRTLHNKICLFFWPDYEAWQKEQERIFKIVEARISSKNKA